MQDALERQEILIQSAVGGPSRLLGAGGEESVGTDCALAASSSVSIRFDGGLGEAGVPPEQAVAEALAGKHDRKSTESEVLELAKSNRLPQPHIPERASGAALGPIPGAVGRLSANLRATDSVLSC